MKITRTFLAALIVSLGCNQPSVFADSTFENNGNQYAWGANFGWLNFFADDTNGAEIGGYVCSGYVWVANMGWMNLGDGSPSNGIRYQNNSSTDFGVNVMDDGALRGFAWGANFGWVNFEDTGDPRVDFLTGELSGYAWSANCGWINLGEGQNVNLVTSEIDPGEDTDNDHMADAWEREQVGNLMDLEEGGDFDKDGETDNSEFASDTDASDENDKFRITSATYDFNSVDSVGHMVTMRTSPRRTYSIQYQNDLDPTGWTTDTNVAGGDAQGKFLGDAGTTTTKETDVLPGEAKTFIRGQAELPLAPAKAP